MPINTKALRTPMVQTTRCNTRVRFLNNNNNNNRSLYIKNNAKEDDDDKSSDLDIKNKKLPPMPNLRELAHTARIQITDEEVEDWQPKINAIVGWFGQLNDIDIDREWERLGLVNVKRGYNDLNGGEDEDEDEDETRFFRTKYTEDEKIVFDRERLLNSAKNYEGGYFRTPRIMGETTLSSDGDDSSSLSSTSSSTSNQRQQQQQQQPISKEAIEQAMSGPTQALDEDVLGFNLVVGEILTCQNHPDPESSKLLVSTIDCGDEDGPRSVCSGIAQHYENPLDLVGKKVILVGNLKARNMKGVESHGMVLCASTDDKQKIEVIEAPLGSSNGERLTFAGLDTELPPIHAENKVVKKKLWDKVKDGFTANALDGSVSWFNNDLISVNGPVKPKSLKNCKVG